MPDAGLAALLLEAADPPLGAGDAWLDAGRLLLADLLEEAGDPRADRVRSEGPGWPVREAPAWLRRACRAEARPMRFRGWHAPGPGDPEGAAIRRCACGAWLAAARHVLGGVPGDIDTICWAARCLRCERVPWWENASHAPAESARECRRRTLGLFPEVTLWPPEPCPSCKGVGFGTLAMPAAEPVPLIDLACKACGATGRVTLRVAAPLLVPPRLGAWKVRGLQGHGRPPA